MIHHDSFPPAPPHGHTHNRGVEIFGRGVGKVGFQILAGGLNRPAQHMLKQYLTRVLM
jgi:hypothetical protein